MSADDIINEAIPWIAGAFVVVWVAIILIKILRNTWKDD